MIWALNRNLEWQCSFFISRLWVFWAHHHMIRFSCLHLIRAKKVAFEEVQFPFERLLSYCPFAPIAVCGSWFVVQLTFAIFLPTMTRFLFLNVLSFHSNDLIHSIFRSIFQFTVASLPTFVSTHCFLDPNCSNLSPKTHSSLILIELSYGILEFVSPNSYGFDPNLHIVLQTLVDISLIPHFPSAKEQHFAHMKKSFALFNYHIFGSTFAIIQFVSLELHFTVPKRSNSIPIGCYLDWIDDSSFKFIVSKSQFAFRIEVQLSQNTQWAFSSNHQFVFGS